MMRVLAIGPDEQKAIEALVAKATATPIPLEIIQELAKGFDPADVSTRRTAEGKYLPSEFTIDIPDGYRVTYTHEMQPGGLCRHLSVSVSSEKLPSGAAVMMLMSDFGFRGPIEMCATWLEEYAAGFQAVNIVELVDEQGAS